MVVKGIYSCYPNGYCKSSYTQVGPNLPVVASLVVVAGEAVVVSAGVWVAVSIAATISARVVDLAGVQKDKNTLSECVHIDIVQWNLEIRDT